MAFRLLALPPAVMLAAGCSWFSPSIEVGLRLPEPPAHWRQAFPGLRYELACADAQLPPAGWAGVPPGGTATLRLPKRANWPVLAYPVARGARLPPAGGLFPLDLAPGGDALELSWERGPAAEVLRSLAREGIDIGRVNAPRLVAEMLAASDGDPFRLDLPALADRLASGEFRVTDIRLLPARDLALQLPPGTWFLESPLRPAQCSAPGQVLLLPAVPLGPHRLFAVELPGGFALFVGEREILLLPLSP